jgi:muramidase (phage lysozyme)
MNIIAAILALFGRKEPANGGQFGGGGATGGWAPRTPAERNEFAAIEMIRACEGTVGEEGWRALYGWRPGRADRTFILGNDHPRVAFHFNGVPLAPGEPRVPWQYTTAAGGIQLTESTYDRLCKKNGHRGMSPADQVRSALELIEEVGARGDIQDGRIRTAIGKLGGIWASLPSSTANQPKRTWDYALDAYLKAGGTLQ